MNQLAFIASARLPALITASGDRASWRFLEFFTAAIRNPNTRRAYARDVRGFVEWCSAAGIASIAAVNTMHVAAYIEQLGKAHPAPTVNRHLAAIRHLFDYLVLISAESTQFVLRLGCRKCGRHFIGNSVPAVPANPNGFEGQG